MKRLLLYLLVTVSVAVFAQRQTDNSDEAKTQTEQPADAGQSSEGALLEASGETGTGDATEHQPEQPANASQDNENEPLEASSETGPDDIDFKPSDEISEDFPVPLPSDI